jgi:hypothetical protein
MWRKTIVANRVRPFKRVSDARQALEASSGVYKTQCLGNCHCAPAGKHHEQQSSTSGPSWTDRAKT